MKLLEAIFGKDEAPGTIMIDPVLHGVTDTDKLELICLSALGLVLAFEDESKDGISIGDFFKLTPVILGAARAMKHFKEAGTEVKDLTTFESESLVGKLVARMPELDSPAAALIAEKTLRALPGLVDLINAIGFARSGTIKRAELVEAVPTHHPDV